jgi:hypothetical protein
MGHQGGSGAPVSQTANNNTGRGQGFTPDHPGSGRGPDAGNNSGIAWNQIGAVFFDLWVLFAIAACYILVQQMLGLIINHFWVKKDPQLTT